MNRKLLVVYKSRYGQTEKVARRIAEIAQAQGLAAEAVMAGEAAEAALREASDVLVAGALYFGRYDGAIVRFVRGTVTTLATRHTGFVTVCGGPDVAQTYVDRFLRRTGWKPDVTATFAGATMFTRYGWFVRFVMRRIALMHGDAADTSRDYEYTDWNAVEAFVRSFVAASQARAA